MGWLRSLFDSLLRMLPGRSTPLCDTCKYDYAGACNRPERPNALKCPDYKRR